MFKIKKWKNQMVRKAVYMASVVYVTLALANTAYAGSIQDSIYVTGTKKMFGDALKAIQIITGVIGLALIAYNLLRMKMCEDNEEPCFKKKAIGIVITVIVIETIGTVAGIIGGYYGVSFS